MGSSTPESREVAAISKIPGSPKAPNSPGFGFPDAWGKNDNWLGDGFKCEEIEPQLLFQADIQEDYSYSPPLWKTCTTSTDARPLLPLGHPCSDHSPPSVTQVIANSREEMLKMIRDLPESCYELSLKDIVDLQSSQEAKVEPPIEEEPGFVLNPQWIKPKKKMSRSDSMDNSAFLIKTFFPSFSASTRKLAPGNSSRIIPRSSSGAGCQSKKHPRDKSVQEATRITNNNSNKFRHEADKRETGCWPSISGRKIKTGTWRKMGCLF